MKMRVKRDGFDDGRRVAAPPEPEGFRDLPTSPSQAREVGWGRACIEKHAFAPSPETLTFVCGLPSVTTRSAARAATRR
ncbi:cytochrome-b5 reductase [Aureococcus anophagefferens]|nr:cytochrome-b5 reductase [Aureococcus anophagefferens]